MTPTERTALPSPVQHDAQESGPFLVKVDEPCAHCEGGGEVWGEDPDTGLPDEPGLKSSCGRCAGSGARVVSVKAFETVDGARGYARALLAEHEVWSTAEVDALPAAGGSIPLPDGREITVEQKPARFFLDLLTGEDTCTLASGIAAFNARHATERFAAQEGR